MLLTQIEIVKYNSPLHYQGSSVPFTVPSQCQDVVHGGTRALMIDSSKGEKCGKDIAVLLIDYTLNILGKY